MKIVSDTGPIIGLSKIKRIFLLKDIAEGVIIPPFVHKELFGKVGLETEEIDRALNDFIKVVELMPLEPAIESVIADLGEGEKQSINLAYNIKGENILLLIDDYAGREVAQKLKIPITGLVGILLLAKEKGIVGNVTSLVEDLRNNGYWLSNETIDVTRRLAGE